MPTVLVLISRKQRARRYLGPWLGAGARQAGDKVRSMFPDEYRDPCSEVLVHYGFDGDRDSAITKAHDDYVAAGLKAVYVDLGYFKLKERFGRFRFYHRFSINGRHPDAYFQSVRHQRDRADELGIRVAKKMRQGKKIILCGMSPKASAFDGVPLWEEETIAELRKHTDRPIIHRPKPGRARAPALPMIPTADGYSDPLSRKLEHELADAWAVVSHHSNAGLDALVAGVPCFQEEGVALALGLSDLALIDAPRLPSYEDRQQLVNDIAYAQFNGWEIEAGTAWRSLKADGFIP